MNRIDNGRIYFSNIGQEVQSGRVNFDKPFEGRGYPTVQLTLFKDNDEDNMIDKFIAKGFRPKTAVKMTLILAGSKTFIDAQDRFLIEFGGNFTVLYKCIDILEEYYNEKSNINETA